MFKAIRAQLGLLVIFAAAAPAQFSNVAGQLKQISASNDGEVWGVNASQQLFRWNGSAFNWTPGAQLAQVSVGSATNIWGLDAAGNVLHRVNAATWQSMNAGFTSISVAADGTVVGVKSTGEISRWNGRAWVQLPGTLKQISAGSASNTWGLNSAGQVYKWTGTAWQQMPGQLREISAGPTGTVRGLDANNGLFEWNGSSWNKYDFKFLTVSVGNPVTMWGITPAGQIQKGNPTISATAIVLTPVTAIVSTPVTIATAADLAATSGLPPAMTFNSLRVVRSNSPGSMICGETNPCSDEKADYVGPYKMAISCDVGDYENVWGGTCWKCPAPSATGTDRDKALQLGWWSRTGSDPTKDDSCKRLPALVHSKAIFVKGGVKSGLMAWDCGSGEFWDMHDASGNWTWWGGACWKCPADTPIRSTSVVWGDQACENSLDNQYAPATLVKFNGCPEPNAAAMGLPGKRLPGRPFLDIAAGWSLGVASGGCFACPGADNDGNVLVTERNAKLLINHKDDNTGCTVRFKWRPATFQEPGLAGMQGLPAFIQERGLLDSHLAITAYLYSEASATGLEAGSAASKAYVQQRWAEIGQSPYRSDSFRAFLFAQLAATALAGPSTDAERQLVSSFQNYVQARRTYVAQEALDMYDAWKKADDSYHQSIAQSPLSTAFYYGTVPLDFHEAAAVGLTLGAPVAGTLGSIAGSWAWCARYTRLAQQAEQTFMNSHPTEAAYIRAFREGRLVGGDLLKSAQQDLNRAVSSATKPVALGRNFDGIDVLKAFKGATGVAVGAAVIEAAFAVIQSVAIDQFIDIVTARSKLQAALATASQPVNLAAELASPDGADVMAMMWSKATADSDEPGLVARGAYLANQAQAAGYPASQQ